jgi:hypothetical protein
MFFVQQREKLMASKLECYLLRLAEASQVTLLGPDIEPKDPSVAAACRDRGGRSASRRKPSTSSSKGPAKWQAKANLSAIYYKDGFIKVQGTQKSLDVFKVRCY